MSDARARTPRPVPDRRDLRGLALSPTDGFVLSRIDGMLTEHDLVAATGLPSEMVAASLKTLEGLGVITYANGQPSPTVSVAVPADPPPDPSPRQSSIGLRTEPLSSEDEAALAEQVDLEDAIKRAVLTTFARLDRFDHYALLGAERASDRKGIKRAYYELAGKFHPDKYFRKNLGTYKAKMEAIFARVTLAHDVLSDRERRAEYDAYLAEQRRLMSAEDLMAEALDEVQRVERNVERQVRAQASTPSPAHGVPGVGLEPGAAPSRAPPAPAIADPGVNVDVAIAARRDALARRLLGSRASSSSPPAASNPTVPPAPTAADAMESLKRRYEQRLARAKVAEARKYLNTAQTAQAAGDPIAAANAYRVAAQLAPDDPEIVTAAQAAQSKVDTLFAETYTRQAAYEERHEQWREAFRSWARVCKSRPDDAPAHERAANAALMAGGDNHEAGRFARRAVEIDPTHPGYRVTLAKIYLASGLPHGARRELETAAQMAPQDGTIRSMLKKL